MVLPEGETETIGDPSIKIGDAVIDDIPEIMTIQLSQIRKPEELTHEEAKQGFLVYKVSEDEL